jgi:hypothetical protein
MHEHASALWADPTAKTTTAAKASRNKVIILSGHRANFK